MESNRGLCGLWSMPLKHVKTPLPSLLDSYGGAGQLTVPDQSQSKATVAALIHATATGLEVSTALFVPLYGSLSRPSDANDKNHAG